MKTPVKDDEPFVANATPTGVRMPSIGTVTILGHTVPAIRYEEACIALPMAMAVDICLDICDAQVRATGSVDRQWARRLADRAERLAASLRELPTHDGPDDERAELEAVLGLRKRVMQ